MSSRELDAACGFVCRSLDRIVQCLDGLTERERNWCPPAPSANSLYAIAVHSLANAEENILSVLCWQPLARLRGDEEHESEWAVRATTANHDCVPKRWTELRLRLETALSSLDPAELDRERPHPRRGSITGREVLYVVARHTAEHQGQAELTRDLIIAQRR